MISVRRWRLERTGIYFCGSVRPSCSGVRLRRLMMSGHEACTPALIGRHRGGASSLRLPKEDSTDSEGTVQMCFLTVLEVGSPSARCQRGRVLERASSWLGDSCLLMVPSRTRETVSPRVSSPLVRTPAVRLRPHHQASFNFNHLLVRLCLQIQSRWRLRLQHVNLGVHRHLVEGYYLGQSADSVTRT